jgi:hypothetical protein
MRGKMRKRTSEALKSKHPNPSSNKHSIKHVKKKEAESKTKNVAHLAIFDLLSFLP